MAATKTARQLIAVGTAVGAGATVNGTEWNLSTAYGGRVNVRITNGGTGPTSMPVVKFYSGDATGKKYLVWQASGDLLANSVTDITYVYELADMFANISVTGGATTGSTVEAFGQEATSL